MDSENQHKTWASNPTIYLIRHGEKPPKIYGKDQIGLSSIGIDRAHGLIKVFGKHSEYDIGLILAQKPKECGRRARPWETVKPLAESLGDSVLVDINIDRDDTAGVIEALRSFRGPGNVLISWEHARLTNIIEALGVQDALHYPKDRFDVIWTVEPPYTKINRATSEHIPGLDDQYSNEP